MNKGGNNSAVCSDMSQTIKREPAACKISARASECETTRPSAPESNPDGIVGVTNFAISKPNASANANGYHLIGDKCVQTEVTATDSPYLQTGGGDGRTLTVSSAYNNLNGGAVRPPTSVNTAYHHDGGGNGRTTDTSTNPVYHHGGSNGNIAMSSSYHHNTSGVILGGSGGGTSGSAGGSANYQDGIGSGSLSSGYHLHHGSGIVAGNCGTMSQVNAPPGYYYPPILNSQQPLLRPIMAAQPPLYSPLLTPQQHSYPMPHASPSTGTSYFATLTETMRGSLSDMLPGASENVYKDTGQPGRQGSGNAHSDKSCDGSDARLYSSEACQRRLQVDSTFGQSSSSYPSCGEVTRSSHDQRSFDDYSRMGSFTEDGSSRNWEGMGGCGTTACSSRAAGVHPNHAGHPYAYSYTDCRIDVAWNKCVAGMGVGSMSGTPSVSGESFHAQDQQLDSTQVKTVATRGPPGHATLTVNMNVGISQSDPSMSRSHYDYQPLPGTQIPPFLQYLAPLNYQQVSESRAEVRNEQRSNVNRSDTQVCDSQINQNNVRQMEHSIPPSENKRTSHNLPSGHTPLPPLPQSLPTSTHPTPTTSYTLANVQTSVAATSTSVDVAQQEFHRQQKNMSVLHAQCGLSTYKKESTEEDGHNKSQSCETCCVTEGHQTTVTTAAVSVPCSVEAGDARKNLASAVHKKKGADESVAEKKMCLLCDLPVSDGQQETSTTSDSSVTTSACSVDTLTVMSKVSVGEKLGSVLGLTLPRHVLHTTTVCGKCYHLINELDVMEHRLTHYRKYIISKVEATSEKYGSRLGTYRKAQQQQQQHQQHQQHQQQYHQHQHQQHHQEQMLIQYQTSQSHIQQEHDNRQQQLPSQHLAPLQQQHHPTLPQQHLQQHAVNQIQQQRQQQPEQQQMYVSHHQQHHSNQQHHQQLQQQQPQQQQPQQQQHHLPFQHHQPKSQPVQDIVSHNVPQPEIQQQQQQSGPQPQPGTSVTKRVSNDAGNMAFVDCDIDIEDCECNLVGETQVPSKESSDGDNLQICGLKKTETEVQEPSDTCNRTNSEFGEINSVSSEHQQKERLENPGQTCSDVIEEDNTGCTNGNQRLSLCEEQKDAGVEASPAVPPSLVEDEPRKVEDATEYHKPTLLTKNIKAKKHAKLQICRQCDQVFSNRQALVRHIERRHKAYAFHFSCDTCHKKFSSERALTRHVQQHKTYQCKLCDNIFLRKAKLKKHLENHAQESLTCKVCLKECASLQALISHVKTHTQKKVVSKCEVCAETFANNRNLKEHMRTHTGEKPFSCDNCGRKFSHRGNMQAHRDFCTGQYRYTCQICGKGFALESVYQHHLAEHKGQFDYRCTVCGRGFRKASGLQAHLPVHNAQRQTYTCQVCSQNFTSKSGYNSHMARHSGEDGYVCPVCEKTIIRRSDLKDHLHRHAGNKTHACTICDATFYFRGNMKHHMRTAHRLLRPYVCKFCSKSFSSSYNYRSHVRIHTGEKPHQCKSCGKTFSSKGNYNRHLKCHITQAVAPLTAEIE